VSAARAQDDRNIYVGSLPLDADEEELRALFAPHGEILSLHLVRDRASGQSRGFGFVKLDPAAVQAAVDDLDGLELRGCRVRVNVARDKGARAPRRRY
jgi:RNA recognition motif-containing protein